MELVSSLDEDGPCALAVPPITRGRCLARVRVRLHVHVHAPRASIRPVLREVGRGQST